MSINRVNMTGNLTRDPELKTTTGGLCVLGMGIAVNDRRRNPTSGDWEDTPNFIECTMFGNRAQGIHPYLHKGDKVSLEGRLHWSQWETEGKKRSKIEVIVDEVALMSRRPAGGGEPEPPVSVETDGDTIDGEIPF